jgi:hypothetical protein
MKHLRRHDNKHRDEYLVCGGYPGVEEDGSTTCVGCGKLLDYELTQYGVEEELHHFAQNLDMSPLDQGTAFELLKVFEGIAAWEVDNNEIVAIGKT